MAELAYAYLAPSEFAQRPGQADLSLATSGGVAPSGAVAHPFFFSVSWRSQPWWRKRC